MKIDCNNCIFIDNMESQQEDNRIGHHCIKYDKVKLFHLDMHPKIYPCGQCKADKYVNYSERNKRRFGYDNR